MNERLKTHYKMEVPYNFELMNNVLNSLRHCMEWLGEFSRKLDDVRLNFLVEAAFLLRSYLELMRTGMEDSRF